MDVIEKINTIKGDIRVLHGKSNEGQPLASEYGVKVLTKDWDIYRWWFFDEFELKKAKQFGTKLLYNPDLQEKTLSGEASWIQIQETYWKTETKIVDQFDSRNLLEYSPSDFEGELNTDFANTKLWDILRETYTAISKVISDFSLSSDELEPYLNTQIEVATAVAKTINDPDGSSITELRPRDRWVEYRGDEEIKWVSEDVDDIDLLRIVDLYMGEYRPVAAVIAPRELFGVIKNKLDWEKTHRQWNDERECWEIDLDSLEYVIEIFRKNHFTIRVSDLVAQICNIDTPRRPAASRPKEMLPTMELLQNQDFALTTDLLILPGVDPDLAQNLLYEGFHSIQNIAHSSADAIARTEGVSNSMAHVVVQGALAAIGEETPAAVNITNETPLPLSEAQQTIDGLASSGVPPKKSELALIKMSKSEIYGFESVDNRDLVHLYNAGFRSVGDLLETNISKISNVNYITQTQANYIQKEAKEYGVRKSNDKINSK